MDEAPIYEKTPGQLLARRILFGFVALVVLVIAIQLLVQYLTTGIIYVATKSNANITIVSNAQLRTVAHGQGVLSVRVHTGDYTIKVDQGTSATAAVAHVAAHQTAKISLGLSPVSAVGLVSDTTATNLEASDTVLYFLNSDGQLCLIDSQNNQRVVAVTPTFTSINWVNSTYGVGLGGDGALYSITNGSIAVLPTGLSNITAYAVSSDKNVYAADGATVYSLVAGKATRLMTLPGAVATMAANGDTVVAATSPNGEGGGAKSTVAAIHSGHTSQVALAASSVAVSPNGSFITVGGVGNANHIILNNSLTAVATLPASNVFTDPVWLSNSQLVYAVNGQLWRFDLSSSTATLLATMPLRNPVAQIVPNDDQSFLYVGVQATGGSSIIERVGLRGQTVPTYLSQLQSILPYTTDDYFITLTNFTSPVLFVAPIPPLTNSGAGYVQEANSYLQQIGVSAQGLQIRYVSP